MRFEALARERVEAWEGRLIEVGGEPDHVHLLFTLPPKHALADFVNALKTGTSRRLRSEFPREVGRFYRQPGLWSRSYCVISAGGAPLEVIRRYIEGQGRPENGARCQRRGRRHSPPSDPAIGGSPPAPSRWIGLRRASRVRNLRL